MTVIRWGILGCGRIARKFVQDLQTLPDAHLHAVASSDKSRAVAFAAEYGAAHAFDRYEDLLACPDLDVVYIATTHNFHYEHTLLCLRAGVAVLCEKPFALNSGQVQTMVQTARERGVFLMEALWSRFMPCVVKAKELADSGAIGSLTGLRADFGFRAPFSPDGRLFNRALGGGSLLDIGIYPLFLAYLLLGKPQTIRAAAVLGQTGVDEQCGMVLTYENGAMANLFSTITAKTDTDACLYGTAGNLHLAGRFHEGQSVTIKPAEGDRQIYSYPRQTWGYHYEASHVMQCLREGRTESPLWSLDDSLNLMELLDAVRQQAGIVYAEDARC